MQQWIPLSNISIKEEAPQIKNSAVPDLLFHYSTQFFFFFSWFLTLKKKTHRWGKKGCFLRITELHYNYHHKIFFLYRSNCVQNKKLVLFQYFEIICPILNINNLSWHNRINWIHESAQNLKRFMIEHFSTNRIYQFSASPKRQLLGKKWCLKNTKERNMNQNLFEANFQKKI